MPPALLIPAALVAVAVGAVVATTVAVMALFAPKVPDVGAASARRNVTARSSIGTHKPILGQTRAAAVETFYEKTSDGKLYQVLTFAPHAVAEIGAILFNDVEVPLDGAGNAVAPGTFADGTAPKSYAGVARIIKGNGTVTGDASFNDFLTTNCKTWTADCRQDGRAKIAIQWTYNEDALSSGLPNVTAIIRGALQYDPRASSVSITSSATGTPGVITCGSAHGCVPGDFVFIRVHSGSVPAISGAYEVGTTPSGSTLTLLDYSQALAITTGGTGGDLCRMVWSDNAALVGTTYLCDKDHGISAAYDIEFVGSQCESAANSCDEYVDRASPTSTFTADASTDKITYALGQPLGNIPDLAQVTVSSSTSLPAGLNTGDVYYFKQSGSGATGYLCTSLANAQAVPPVKVNITSAGTGTHTIRLVVTFTANLATGYTSANSLSLFSNALRLLTGTKVRVDNTGGALPTGLSEGVDYYVIFQTERRIRLADSLANARRGVAVTLSGAGSGSNEITVLSDLRYTCNGIVSTAETPKAIADRIAECMAGHFIPSGITFGFYPGVWRAPTVSLDESDLRGAIQVTTLQSAQDSYNSVKGVYFDPFGNFQPADFPAYKSATYIADDNGEVVWKDFKFELINSTWQALRVAHIALERIRRERTVTMALKYTAFQVAVGDVVEITNALWGMADETYEVQSWTFSVGTDTNGIPTLNVDIVARQTDEDVFDGDTASETGAKRAGTVSTIADVLGAPMDVTASASGGTVTIKWSPIQSAKVKGYRVVASPLGGNVSVGSVLDGLRSATEMTTPLVNGNYTIHVNGVDLQGNHGPSGTDDVTVAAGISFSPYSRTYDEGSGSEPIPVGASQVIVTVRGAGGGGGFLGKGGGGGAYSTRTISLHSSDAGKVFNWAVGEPGAGGGYDPEGPTYIAGTAGGASSVTTPVALNAGSFTLTAGGGNGAASSSSSTAAGGTASGGTTNTSGSTSTDDGGAAGGPGGGAGGVRNTSNGASPGGGGGGSNVGLVFNGGKGEVKFEFS